MIHEKKPDELAQVHLQIIAVREGRLPFTEDLDRHPLSRELETKSVGPIAGLAVLLGMFVVVGFSGFIWLIAQAAAVSVCR